MDASLPWKPAACCHSGFSGVAPLSLVVSVSGKTSPSGEGMKEWLSWTEELLFSTSWVIAMDGYVIIALCYVLWLGCCAVIGRRLGMRRSWQHRPGSQSGGRKPREKYKKVIVYQNPGRGREKALSSFEGLRCTFSISGAIKKPISCYFNMVSSNNKQNPQVIQNLDSKAKENLNKT